MREQDVVRFWAKTTKTDSCWLFPFDLNTQGYGRFWICVPRPPLRVFAHRLSWELANGPILDSLCVLHRCDNPPCINPGHLFLGTLSDNMRDRALKGKQNTSHLVLADVFEIRRRRLSGEQLMTIANDFNVSMATVSDIGRGKTWKYAR